MHHQKKIILLAGPTASGKSKLAINLAKKLKYESKYNIAIDRIDLKKENKPILLLDADLRSGGMSRGTCK